jgi:hypothetical protein
MKITILIEGDTEKAFMPSLREFLGKHLAGNMPRLDPFPYDGRIPQRLHLRKKVETLLKAGSDHVIALTDVYTGIVPHDFESAADAKKKMKDWVRDEPRFHPHAAQHDFEAWLLPFWATIQRLSGTTRKSPSEHHPEDVNHDKPPSKHLAEVFHAGSKRKYSKPRDAKRILRENDLQVSIDKCPELKSFVNTIIGVCGGKCLD